MYDELIRIPLILKPAAGVSPHRRVVESQVRIIDVAPTIFELVGVEAPESFVGRSLLPLFMGQEDGDRVAFSEATLYGTDKLSWRTSRYKLIYDLNPAAPQRVELYDWRDDPQERRNLVGSHPELVDRLRGELERFVAGLAAQAQGMSELRPTSLSPQHIESLKSLGYIR